MKKSPFCHERKGDFLFTNNVNELRKEVKIE